MPKQENSGVTDHTDGDTVECRAGSSTSPRTPQLRPRSSVPYSYHYSDATPNELMPKSLGEVRRGVNGAIKEPVEVVAAATWANGVHAADVESWTPPPLGIHWRLAGDVRPCLARKVSRFSGRRRR